MVYIRDGSVQTNVSPIEHAARMAEMGAGEIIINSIDRDGTMAGYDIHLIKSISETVDIPIVAIGGAGKVDDFARAVTEGHATAVAAGSLFVFYGPRKAVLINYPEQASLMSLFEN
jgi:cyclase